MALDAFKVRDGRPAGYLHDLAAAGAAGATMASPVTPLRSLRASANCTRYSFKGEADGKHCLPPHKRAGETAKKRERSG